MYVEKTAERRKTSWLHVGYTSPVLSFIGEYAEHVKKTPICALRASLWPKTIERYKYSPDLPEGKA
jgi:hypothetical protein